MDSHANSPVVGCNVLVTKEIDQQVEVQGFTKALGSKQLSIVNCLVAYDNKFTRKTVYLPICNALQFKEMKHNLIPPFLMQLAGLRVNEVPKFMADEPTVEHHSVYDPKTNYQIPLLLHGIVSYIPTRKPSEHELFGDQIQIYLTPRVRDWNPHCKSYAQQESRMLDDNGEIVAKVATINNQDESEIEDIYTLDEHTNNIQVSSEMTEVSKAHDPLSFQELVKEVFHKDDDTDELQTIGVNGVISRNQIKRISPKRLLNAWNINLKAAKSTLQVTTQHLVRSMIHPTLHKRYSTNDQMVRYQRLDCNVFTDTYFASKSLGKSIRGYASAELFTTDFGFVEMVPMEKEANVYLPYKSFFKHTVYQTGLSMTGLKSRLRAEL